MNLYFSYNTCQSINLSFNASLSPWTAVSVKYLIYWLGGIAFPMPTTGLTHNCIKKSKPSIFLVMFPNIFFFMCLRDASCFKIICIYIVMHLYVYSSHLHQNWGLPIIYNLRDTKASFFACNLGKTVSLSISLLTSERCSLWGRHL